MLAHKGEFHNYGQMGSPDKHPQHCCHMFFVYLLIYRRLHPMHFPKRFAPILNWFFSREISNDPNPHGGLCKPMLWDKYARDLTDLFHHQQSFEFAHFGWL